MAGVVLAYLAISLAYSLRLKHVPLIELACVGSGFTLRAIGGGAAAHVLISPWFLVMTSFGALLIVAGKRTSEQAVLGNEQAAHRVALEAYPAGFLRGVFGVMAMTVTVTTYCLWAFRARLGAAPAASFGRPRLVRAVDHPVRAGRPCNRARHQPRPRG